MTAFMAYGWKRVEKDLATFTIMFYSNISITQGRVFLASILTALSLAHKIYVKYSIMHKLCRYCTIFRLVMYSSYQYLCY